MPEIAAKQKTLKLSYKQNRFKDEFVANNGNAFQAAKDAGYKGNNATLRSVGSENLTKPNIINAIANKQAVIVAKCEKKIMDRIERQAFWSETAESKDYHIADRLRASELLGKSEADFTENINTTDLVRQAEIATEEAAEKEKRQAITNIRMQDILAGTRKAE